MQIPRYPDDILTKAHSKHDVRLNPHIIAPDPYEPKDQYIDVFGPDNKDLLTTTEQLNTMSTGDDDLSSGINGRLRPRKSYVSGHQVIKASRRLDSKSQEKPKRITAPSKTLLNKPDDLSNKSDCTTVIDFLCPYCDKSFVSKQAVSKHARRIHFSTSKQDSFINCLYCNHIEAEPNDIVRHMIDSHPNQYFACLDCHTRFTSTTELAEHKLNVCERQKLPYRSKLRKKLPRSSKKSQNLDRQVAIREEDRHGYNGIVISCELKPTHVQDAADIEDNITTNLILPPGKNLGHKIIDKNAVIVLDDLQWNKRIPHNFSFHNTEADQILSRLGVVHRSPRTGESTRKDWFKAIDDASQKFERCFDTSFYSKVASNVQENLSKFLDGSFNFNPDPNHTIKTRKAKNSVPINTVEGFPILLSCEQYSRNIFDGYMPRAIAPKHKWKWDNLENDKNPFNPDVIKRDSHVNNCIVTLVSSLDIWTQLCMRRKFEDTYKNTPIEKKTEKRNIIGKELKEILESRQLPASSSQISRNYEAAAPARDGLDFPASLGLTPAVPKYEVQPAVLSGEWVRPRCYVCCACGAQTRDPKALSSHISTEHPNAQVQHYEIAGELLLNADILKYLYVPPSPVHNRTRPLRGFRECTKCNKSITIEDLHQHMLDCAGDMPAVRRKCRYRQFGVRKRRTRLPDNRIRKKIRKEIHRQNGRPRPKIRTEVGDAETIRKMLADLPAKRQRVMINPLNPTLRPRRKIVKQRNQLTLKRRSTEENKNRNTNATSLPVSGEVSENNDIIKTQDDNKTIKSNIKRVQQKLSRRNEIMNKKTTTKARRNPAVTVTDPPQSSSTLKNDSEPPSDVVPNTNLSQDVQTNQLSIENLSNKIDINSGPSNTREQANRSSNNGSNNRDNQNPDTNDNGNSRDLGAPPQNIQLKHSIARLTADSDTQDKAVQFHHLFLVQQECNNVTQHVPSGQSVLFENKTVASKLDKPPLLTRHKDDLLDSQNLLKGKSNNNKPRKKLNDCIAMLKNKLFEPAPNPPNVSIQCQIDESPKISSLDIPKILNSNRIDMTVQCPDTDSASTDTIITPRRRQSINADKAIKEHIANFPTIGEYIKKNSELIAQQKVFESSTDLMNKPETETNINAVSTNVKSSSNFRQSTPPQEMLTLNLPKTSQTQPKHLTEGNIEKTKQPIKEPHLDMHQIDAFKPQKAQSKQKIETNIVKKPTDVLSSTQNTIEINSQGDKPKHVNNLTLNSKIQEIAPQNTDGKHNEQIISKTNKAEIIPPAHCNAGVESILTAPLDLSGKKYGNEVIAHCSKQDLTYDSTCGLYETLDLSNKPQTQKESNEYLILPFNDEIVDLRVKHITTTQSADSSLYTDESSSNLNTATDLSLRGTKTHCVPTDLSVKVTGKTISVDSSKRNIHQTSTLYKKDAVTGSQENDGLVCLNLSAKYLETPTDLSKKPIRHEEKNSCARSLIDTTIYHNLNATRNEKCKYTPADLSAKTEKQFFSLDKTKPKNQHLQRITDNARHAARKISSSLSISRHSKIEGVDIEHREEISSQCRRVQLHTNETEVHHKGVSITSGDVTISLMQNHSSLSKSEHINSRKNYNEVDSINVENNLSKTQLSANNHAYDDTYPHNQGLHLTRDNCESSTNEATLPHVVKSATGHDATIVSSSKIQKENTDSDYTPTRTSGLIKRTSESVSSISFTEKENISDPFKSSENELVKHSAVNDKAISTSLEHDPETAKKIAMLPKELVDILGNMPVDHRNQLLNVLPQYVSTSTTTTVNKSQNNDFIPGSLPYPNISQYSFSENQRSKQPVEDAFQLEQSSPSVIKYDEKHSHSNAVIADGTSLGKLKRESVSNRNDDSMKTINDIEKRIYIDLTDDKVVTSQNASPEKENKNLGMTMKPTVQKTNNDKTASLRAVRIKTPSERQKYMITDTQCKRTYQENNNTINLHSSEKETEDVGFLAVQQFEITTTEETKVDKSKTTASLLKKPDSTLQDNVEQNILTSPKTIVNDKNNFTSNDNNTTKSDISSSGCGQSITDVALTPLPVKTVLNNNIFKEDGTKTDEPAVCSPDIKLKTPHQPETEIELNIPHSKQIVKDAYEDDSEDDVSLAIIVKQKLKDQVSQSDLKDDNSIIFEKMDLPKHDSHNKLMTCNKTKQSNDLRNKILENIDQGNDVDNEDTKEKHSKKNKRSRKNNVNIPKITDDKFQSDVNKENTVCSEEMKQNKLADMDGQKCSENSLEKISTAQNEDVSSGDSTNTHEEKEKTKLKEYSDVSKQNKNLIDTDLRQQSNEGSLNILGAEPKIKKKNSSAVRYKLNTEDLICASKTVVTVESQAISKNVAQSNLSKQSPEKMYTNLTIELERSVICSDEKKETDVNIQQINNTLSVKISSLQKDNSVKPLRRSRRGKSLFIENTEMNEKNLDQADNGSDQRGPLTKKQLIFSKLLLDGDELINTVNSSENDDALRVETYEQKSVPSVVTKNVNISHKSHKRKQSPQIKKKLKRKKSLESKDTIEISEINTQLDHLDQEPHVKQIHSEIVSEKNAKPVSPVEEKLPKIGDDARESNDLNEESSNSESCTKSIPVKRKCINLNTSEIISEQKKIKTSSDKESDNKETKENKKNTFRTNENIKQNDTVIQEKKPAARRGRSKSVFVKSSVPKLYDPYDINLEDMVPITEPFTKKGAIRDSAAKSNKCLTIARSNLIENDDIPICSIQDNTEEKSDILVVPGQESKGVMSDSDDSSKSDVPLKKYVEEKERKKCELKIQEANMEDPNKSTSRKRNKQIFSLQSDKINEDICPDDHEERLRSEQFMESFGFFSERKPRKSNLLATKKISETFHIIANEKDDSFFELKEKANNKKIIHCDKISADDESNIKDPIIQSNKKVSKRGRKKKISTKIEPSYCVVCRKEFRRPDNFIRHQMTLAHVTRVSEEDSKLKSQDPNTIEESNYLVIYKQQLDRLRVLQDKITKRKKYCKSLEKIILPTLEEIIADVTRTVKEQQLARRELSRDEALFLDCCELLNASHDDGSRRPKRSSGCDNCLSCTGTSIECLNLLEKRINESLEGKCDDGDVDSITAQDILESEEVRNLENDLISGLKEAACANSFNGNNLNSTFLSETEIDSHLNDIVMKDPETLRQTDDAKNKYKKGFEVKEKMYPDIIEDINMFEDKFDKIKRKCRSQAAKQTQYVETITSHKSRKKVDKKKRKKSPKKNLQSAVPTKGALKGFDGVKVSISTSEIDMSSILPPLAGPSHGKRKKRSNSKRKREHTNSDASKGDYGDKNKDSENKVLDVYEFMDNEDAELFEFRPSTLMERFKSINNKDMPGTSKSHPAYNDDPDVSSESGSDGDDFVYMSDDYVCSDAETENSLMSCETANLKIASEIRKPSTPPKRKETAEKNAVMGKIFKHNAVRSEKKCIRNKEPLKPKANLDQLFDSLLEEEPSSSMLAKSSLSPHQANYDDLYADSPLVDNNEMSRPLKGDENQSLSDETDNDSIEKVRTPSPLPYTSLVAKKRKSLSPVTKIDVLTDKISYPLKSFPSTSKIHDSKKSSDKDHKRIHHRKKSEVYTDFDDATPKRRNTYSPNYDDDSLLRVDDSLPNTEDSFTYTKPKSKEKGKEIRNKSSTKSIETVITNTNFTEDVFDHSDSAGVARQRARRKCTVGKQNVLAETWSSESEPDGVPPRPNSADSVAVGFGRKKKSRKKEGHALGGRKGSRQSTSKKSEAEDVANRRSSGEGVSRVVPTSRPSAVGAVATATAATRKPRPRLPPYYWSDEEDEQEHVQQHGWIVGDSHKKLVTMLAHAKGKRNNDDRRNLLD